MIHIVTDPDVWLGDEALAACGASAPFTDEGDMPAGFDFVELEDAELADCRLCREKVGLKGVPERRPRAKVPFYLS